jgi:hypothetical protein
VRRGCRCRKVWLTRNDYYYYKILTNGSLGHSASTGGHHKPRSRGGGARFCRPPTPLSCLGDRQCPAPWKPPLDPHPPHSFRLCAAPPGHRFVVDPCHSHNQAAHNNTPSPVRPSICQQPSKHTALETPNHLPMGHWLTARAVS